jgi:transposase-like protein
MVLSITRWHKAAAYYPPLRLEEYACPKCGSKELEPIGRRTIRCKKCRTTFTIGTEATEEKWIVWPFFWWIPMIWPIPTKEN